MIVNNGFLVDGDLDYLESVLSATIPIHHELALFDIIESVGSTISMSIDNYRILGMKRTDDRSVSDLWDYFLHSAGQVANPLDEKMEMLEDLPLYETRFFYWCIGNSYLVAAESLDEEAENIILSHKMVYQFNTDDGKKDKVWGKLVGVKPTGYFDCMGPDWNPVMDTDEIMKSQSMSDFSVRSNELARNVAIASQPAGVSALGWYQSKDMKDLRKKLADCYKKEMAPITLDDIKKFGF